MPILAGSLELDVRAGVRSVLLEGLPEFNSVAPQFRINGFTGLDDTAQPRAVLVANGGGPGAVDVDSWEPAEAYYQLSGRIWAGDVRDRAPYRRLLLAALPADRVVPVVILGHDLDVDLQIFVRRYDKAQIDIGQGLVTFSFPLVAPDPFKYGVELLTAECGAFAPVDWYRVYANTGEWFRTYAPDGSVQYRTYEQEEDDPSTLPTTAVLVSGGDEVSRRLTATVIGPLVAGEWWLEDADGTRLWAEVGLVEGQSIVFDSLHRTATLAGANIDHLVQGNYLALRPGTNTYRLLVGSSTSGYATFEGLEAFS